MRSGSPVPVAVSERVRRRGKTGLTGQDIDVDAYNRQERSRYFPRGDHLRRLFVAVELSEWLRHYPKPAEEDNVRAWTDSSLFSPEEHSLDLQSIPMVSVSPALAHAVFFWGWRNLFPSLPSPPLKSTWCLIRADSTQDIDEVHRVVEATGCQVIMGALQKDSILGAVLLASPGADCEPNGCFILGSIRFKHAIHIESTTLSSDHLAAISKKLRRFQFEFVLDPSTGQPCGSRKRKSSKHAHTHTHTHKAVAS